MAEQNTMPFDSRVLVFRPAPNQDAGWFFLKDDAEYLHKILEAIASAKREWCTSLNEVVGQSLEGLS